MFLYIIYILMIMAYSCENLLGLYVYIQSILNVLNPKSNQ